MNALIDELKQLIIDSLDLEDVTPADIDPKAPLFGAGLGLDSIDALELGVAIQKKYHVKLDANSADTRQHFQSVENLAKFITAQRPG
ncbi:MAG TPA: phosphopantetheine-binding protein [Gammaproteobacteria bacterium]|jgi:acyl carrier protein